MSLNAYILTGTAVITDDDVQDCLALKKLVRFAKLEVVAVGAGNAL